MGYNLDFFPPVFPFLLGNPGKFAYAYTESRKRLEELENLLKKLLIRARRDFLQNE